MALESVSWTACTAAPSGALWTRRSIFAWREADMTAATTALSHRLRPLVAAICLGAVTLFAAAPAYARGPEGIADVAEKVIDAVVNISTAPRPSLLASTVKSDGRGAVPQLPPGSPFEEFFERRTRRQLRDRAAAVAFDRRGQKRRPRRGRDVDHGVDHLLGDVGDAFGSARVRRRRREQGNRAKADRGHEGAQAMAQGC